MKEIIYVNTGEVKSGGPDVILNSGAIGSCVVITAYDPINNIGVMAHVMLPGTALIKAHINSTRYANNAIEELINQLSPYNSKKEYIEVCLIGGANVLKRVNDNIGISIIESIEILLDEKEIKICSRSIGGYKRRTVLFDIDQGSVYYTKGDSKEKMLWQSVSKQ